MKWLKYSCTLFLTLGLIACGGDGVDYGDDDDDNGGGGGGNAPALSIALYDCTGATNIPTDCTASNTVASDSDTHVIVSLADADGDIVSFTTTNATLSATTVLISEGYGITTMRANEDATGADQVTASYDYTDEDGDNATVTESISYQVQINSGGGSGPELEVAIYDCDGASNIPTDCSVSNTVTSDTDSHIVVSLPNAEGDIVSLSTSSAALSASSVLISDGYGITTMRANEDATGADQVLATYNYTNNNGSNSTVTDAVNYQVQSNGGGAEPELSVNLFDCTGIAESDIPDSCSTTNNVSIESPATVVVQLNRAGGNPVANEIVNLATDNTDLSVENGKVLTDASGQALATLFANIEKTGADTLTATNSTLAVAGSVNYQVGQANLSMTLTAALADDDELAVDATTTFTVKILNGEGEAYTTPVTVNFTSSCSDATPTPLASITESVTTVNGEATAIYEPLGCNGRDTITATPTISIISPQSHTMLIAVSQASSIEFVSATPTTIYMAESVGTKISEVKFKVLDKTGTKKPNQRVDFAIDKELHGVTFSPAFADSNADGEVITRITSGYMPGSVAVTASFTDAENGSLISTVSNSLAIHTGTPYQETMSLSAETLAMEAWSIDGVENPITLRVSDENRNPVPDGTSIVFSTEGGQIANSCETTGQDSNSDCSLNWVSQNPRPKGHDYDFAPGICIAPGYIPKDTTNTQGNNRYGVGRVTLVAHTTGQESFFDANGNRTYDVGETYTELAEVWFDENENGIRDDSGIYNHDSDNVGERYRDTNQNGGFDTTTGVLNSNDPIDGVAALYNGLSCTKESEAAGNCARDLVDIRDSNVLVMSTSASHILITHFTGSGAGYSLNGAAAIGASTIPLSPGTGDIIVGDRVRIGSYSYLVAAGTSYNTANPQIIIADSLLEAIADGTAITLEGSRAVSEVDLTKLPGHTLAITIQDLNGNQVAAGSTMTIATTNGELSGTTSITIPDGTRLCDVYYVNVGQEAAANNKTTGQMTITVTSPGGVATSTAITVIDAG